MYWEVTETSPGTRSLDENLFLVALLTQPMANIYRLLLGITMDYTYLIGKLKFKLFISWPLG